MNQISLNLNYFNSLNLYILQEDYAVAIMKDYYYYYVCEYNNNYNDDNRISNPTVGLVKSPLNSITDTGIIIIIIFILYRRNKKVLIFRCYYSMYTITKF